MRTAIENAQRNADRITAGYYKASRRALWVTHYENMINTTEGAQQAVWKQCLEIMNKA